MDGHGLSNKEAREAAEVRFSPGLDENI